MLNLDNYEIELNGKEVEQVAKELWQEYAQAMKAFGKTPSVSHSQYMAAMFMLSEGHFVSLFEANNLVLNLLLDLKTKAIRKTLKANLTLLSKALGVKNSKLVDIKIYRSKICQGYEMSLNLECPDKGIEEITFQVDGNEQKEIFPHVPEILNSALPIIIQGIYCIE